MKGKCSECGKEYNHLIHFYLITEANKGRLICRKCFKNIHPEIEPIKPTKP